MTSAVKQVVTKQFLYRNNVAPSMKVFVTSMFPVEMDEEINERVKQRRK